MPYDIIIGRNKSDKQKYGMRGLTHIGKSYVKMGQYTSLSNPVYLDVAKTHVILVAGKRGSGKSYTLATIAEEISNLSSDISKNIAPLIFDTMGIFWTMKYKNEKDSELLKNWNLESKNLPVKVFVPEGKSEEYSKKGIPFDSTFTLKISEIEAEDWINIFGLEFSSLEGVTITKAINNLEKKTDYSIKEIIEEINKDHKIENKTRDITISLFEAADSWGIFSKTSAGTEINELLTSGTTTVLDISTYSSTSKFNVRALVISLISRKIFNSRMSARKKEEIRSINEGIYSSKVEKSDPLVWIFIDEAHEFLPKNEKTPATNVLVQLLREGRQPGISLVLATQQPGQIHNDVLTQSDIVIAHRVTAKQDIAALNEMMQTYLLESIKKSMDDLPREKGSAILLDDNSERLYPIRIRPRFTWHGGEAPTAIDSEINLE